MARASVVLAGIFVGGASRRMGGRAKGLLEAPGGGSIVERLRAACNAHGIPCVLVGRRAEYAGVALPQLADEPEGVGPIGGLRALLRAAGAPAGGAAIALACDMPYVDADLVARLAREAEDAAAYAPRVDGRWEPLAARYDATRALAVVDAHLARGQRALQEVLDALGAREMPLDAPSARALRDWDSPDDVPR